MFSFFPRSLCLFFFYSCNEVLFHRLLIFYIWFVTLGFDLFLCILFKRVQNLRILPMCFLYLLSCILLPLCWILFIRRGVTFCPARSKSSNKPNSLSKHNHKWQMSSEPVPGNLLASPI
ncbi:unnamed protein product [Prunus brigantina]